LTRRGRSPSADAVHANPADWKRARRARRLANLGFDLQRRHPGDGSRLVFATLQDGLRNIVAPSPSALRCVARTHPVAAIIEQLAGEKRV
jgi:hypothetical protein